MNIAKVQRNKLERWSHGEESVLPSYGGFFHASVRSSVLRVFPPRDDNVSCIRSPFQILLQHNSADDFSLARNMSTKFIVNAQVNHTK